MLQLLIAILGILLTILVVVGFHEFGHFIVARLVGVKVLRFSIGFGKGLFSWYDKKGTEYVIAAIPLGGYVKMLDESEETVDPKDLTFAYNRQPFYKKLAIVAAGPLFNLILALTIYWIVFIVGFTSIAPIVGKIAPDSIAALAGMHPKEEIIQVDERKTRSWIAIIVSLLTQMGDKNELQIVTRNADTAEEHHYKLDLTHWQVDKLKPDPLTSLGITAYEPEIPPIISKIKSTSSAAATLKVGDIILAFDNKLIKDWNEFAEAIYKHPDTTVTVKILRQEKPMDVLVKIGYQRDYLLHKYGYLGIAPDYEMPSYLLRHNQYGPLGALSHAWADTKDFTTLNVIVIGKLLTGKISFKSLGGPITIFQSAGSAINNGIIPFLSFLAFLSISIGLVNILPIPGLDGGHILFQFIEFIIRRPIPTNFQILLYRLGLIVLLLLITQALINDIMRL